MTTETDNQRVSGAYRGIASETTRPEIDERVLKLAAAGVRSRYGLARAWVRPLAWAATIALSVALVLELTRDIEVPGPTVPVETLDEPSRSDADLMRSKEEKDVQQNAAKRMPVARPEAAAPATLSADDLAPLREAEEQARMRSVDASAYSTQDAAAEPQVRAAAEEALSVAAGAATDPAWCDAEARAAADSWYACIQQLLDQDLVAEAEHELEAFNRAHPDFEKAPE